MKKRLDYFCFTSLGLKGSLEDSSTYSRLRTFLERRIKKEEEERSSENEKTRVLKEVDGEERKRANGMHSNYVWCVRVGESVSAAAAAAARTTETTQLV